MKIAERALRAVVFGAVLTGVVATTAQAQSAGAPQSYPNKPIRLIVPQSPGGPSDTEGVGSSPAQFGAHLKSEHDTWSKVAKQTGLRTLSGPSTSLP